MARFDPVKRLAEIAKYKIYVGVFSTEQHPSGGGTVAQVAARNHFGHGHTPARPFLTIAKERYKAELTAEWAKQLKSDAPAIAILHAIGKVMVGHVQETIRSSVPPPNAPSTVARKGHSNTLIDTETLLGSIEYRVEART